MSFYIGIDLCNDFSQVSYYDTRAKEPVSVDFSGLDSKYQIPTAVSKSIGREEWFAGDEAGKCAVLGEGVLVKDILTKAVEKNPVVVDDITVMPIDLMKIFLDYLISSAKIAGSSQQADRVCVTLKDYNISVLNIVKGALCELGYEDSLIMSSHEESYIYYALSMKPELWKGDVALFDYTAEGLKYYRLYIANERGNKIIMTHSDDYSDIVPYELSQNQLSSEFMDYRLTELASKAFDKKNISSVYLTGKGFSDDIKAPGFIKLICSRRKAFIGQNLYSKGACYQAYEVSEGSRFKDFILACPQRITTGIEMKITDRGRDKILRMLRPGINWYGADCSYDFIVDNMKELELFLSPVDTSEKQLVRISLTDFPSRPDKTTRITVELSFTSDSRCHLMVKDKGFGEFYPSSGMVINEELLL